MLSPINQFLTSHNLLISYNPCISPDFCLNWEKLKSSIEAERFKHHAKSEFSTVHGTWILIENEDGDHAWELTAKVETSKIKSLSDGIESHGKIYFPAT